MCLYGNKLSPPIPHPPPLPLLLVTWRGMEPTTPVVEAQSLHHWTTREVPELPFQ